MNAIVATPTILTVQEAADVLKVSTRTLYAMTKPRGPFDCYYLRIEDSDWLRAATSTITATSEKAADDDGWPTVSQADGKTDGKKNSWPKSPENPDVAKLAKLIRNNPDPQRTKLDIAREFTGGDEKRSQSLLRKLRDFPHLLNG